MILLFESTIYFLKEVKISDISFFLLRSLATSPWHLTQQQVISSAQTTLMKAEEPLRTAVATLPAVALEDWKLKSSAWSKLSG